MLSQDFICVASAIVYTRLEKRKSSDGDQSVEWDVRSKFAVFINITDWACLSNSYASHAILYFGVGIQRLQEVEHDHWYLSIVSGKTTLFHFRLEIVTPRQASFIGNSINIVRRKRMMKSKSKCRCDRVDERSFPTVASFIRDEEDPTMNFWSRCKILMREMLAGLSKLTLWTEAGRSHRMGWASVEKIKNACGFFQNTIKSSETRNIECIRH